jgi:hypothetical protein
VTGTLELKARRALLVAAGAVLAPSRRRFGAALADPEAAQRRVVDRLVERLRASEYGRRLGVHTRRDFHERVPVVDYDGLAPWLDRQRAQEGAVLTDERVLFYEKTSGSTGPAKYIPYTASLRRSFSRMFAVWAGDLLARGPCLTTGRFYMSVSPSFSHELPTANGVPIGMADDRDYLDGWLRRLVSPFLVGDPALARAHDARQFKRRTCELLLDEPDLEIISVWSPSFLKVLLDEISANREALATRLAPARRAALLADPIDWTRVWPRLRLLSCWTAAAAAGQARALASLLPGVLIQGKGLLATEAPMTVPLLDAPGDMPLVDEVLIELEDDAGQLIPVYAGVEGHEYGIVISQFGGLYRYRMGDRVLVGPRYRATPSLQLVGRTGGVSDLVGEKLNERFVAGVLGELEPDAFFKTLVPLGDHYVLVLDRVSCGSDALAAELDARLRRAHHYHHARALGQLRAPRVCVAANAADLAIADYASRGMKLGDIKPRALHAGPIAGALGALVGAGGALAETCA